jgi:hypothetical protein
MRHLISYNYQFSPGDDNHVYVEDAATAEMHIDYTVEDYVDYHIKGKAGHDIADSKLLYAYSPEMPGACVVYLYYKQSTESKFPRLLSVCYVYKEDSKIFNYDMLSYEMSINQIFKPEFKTKYTDLKDQLYTLHGKEQYTELPWD